MEDHLNNLNLTFTKSNMEIFEIQTDTNLNDFIANLPQNVNVYSTTSDGSVIKVYVIESTVE